MVYGQQGKSQKLKNVFVHLCLRGKKDLKNHCMKKDVARRVTLGYLCQGKLLTAKDFLSKTPSTTELNSFELPMQMFSQISLHVSVPEGGYSWYIFRVHYLFPKVNSSPRVRTDMRTNIYAAVLSHQLKPNVCLLAVGILRNLYKVQEALRLDSFFYGTLLVLVKNAG